MVHHPGLSKPVTLLSKREHSGQAQSLCSSPLSACSREVWRLAKLTEVSKKRHRNEARELSETHSCVQDLIGNE